MKLVAILRRGALIAVGALLLPGASAAPPVDAGGQPAGPDFGVIQFTDTEAFIDLPVSLADAWSKTLEVVAAMNPAVRADLPYLENNGHIIAGDLWIAVETQGDATHGWVRIRMAIPAGQVDTGRTRAEILLDAIADRLEPPKAAAATVPPAAPDESALPPVAQGVSDGNVVNNYYYYGAAPYSDAYSQPLPSWSYVPATWSPWWYGSVCAPFVAQPVCASPWGWNSGWWFGWGGPWCNPWGSSFAFSLNSGWHWSLSACFGSVCSSWGFCHPCWGFAPWWGWNGCSWSGCGWHNHWCGSTIVINDVNVNVPVVTVPPVVALGPRTTNLNLPSDPNGPFATAIGLPGRTVRAGQLDTLPHATDRTSRRAAEPTRPLIVTRTEPVPRPVHTVVVSGQDRPGSEHPVTVPGISRPVVVVGGGSTAPTRTTTSPSRSSRRSGPTVLTLGSAPYSDRVPVIIPSREPASTSAPQAGESAPRPTSAPAGNGGSFNPYADPYPEGRTYGSSGSSPAGSSGGVSGSAGSARPSAPPASAPRPAPAPAPHADPPRTTSVPSAPHVSPPSMPSAPSGGGFHGSSGPIGGGSSGGASSGGGHHGQPR